MSTQSGEPARLRVGVAGWDYKDWRGMVYPDPRPRGFDPVRYLAQYIDLIEINSSFYGPPTPSTGSRWAGQIADLPGFTFSAKLWRRFTHERGEAWTAAEVEEAKAGLLPLLDARKLETLLVQFPMSFRNDEANREWMRDVVAAFSEFPVAIEIRHASWNEPEFYSWLAEQGVGFVNIDQPLFKRCLKPSARSTARTGYVRVHGRNYQDWFRKNAGRDARYDYLYSPAELEPWLDRAREIAAEPGTEEVAVVFNNHFRGQAVVNALQFKAMAEGAPVPGPGPLARAYPEALAGYVEGEGEGEGRGLRVRDNGGILGRENGLGRPEDEAGHGNGGRGRGRGTAG